MARRKAKEGFDENGQPIDAVKGEPDPEALAEIARQRAEEQETAPDIPEDEPREEAPMATPVEPAPNLATVLKEAFKDPEVRTALRDTVTEDPELRALFGINAGQGRPSGYYRRNYQAERHLHVHGGLEVEHAPGFRPLAPDTIKMYIGEDGRKTSDPTLAAKTPDGDCVLTDEYKWFLDVKMQGKRPSQTELVDIEVAGITPGQAQQGPGLVA